MMVCKVILTLNRSTKYYGVTIHTKHPLGGARETGFGLFRTVPWECFGDTIFLLLLAVVEIQKAPVLSLFITTHC